MPKKQIINISIDKNLLKYIDFHFNIPGLKWNRSRFIESCIKAKVDGLIKPEDILKGEIKFNEEKRKFHDNILAELYIKEKRLKGQLKLIPTETLNELKKKSDISTSTEKEKDIEDIIGPIPNEPIIAQNISRKKMKEKAFKIING